MTPQRQLAQFMAKYMPAIAAEGRVALTTLRRFVPGAHEMVYDNYNGLAIGFSPSERPSEAVVSLLFTPRWLTLCFLQNGPQLPDPERLLRGSGNVVRHIRLIDGVDLNQSRVRALIKEALARADVPFNRRNRSKLVIRSVSAKQRPRRPAPSKK